MCGVVSQQEYFQVHLVYFSKYKVQFIELVPCDKLAELFVEVESGQSSVEALWARVERIVL